VMTQDGGQTWKPLGLGYTPLISIPTSGRPFSLLPGGRAWINACEWQPGVTRPQCHNLLLRSEDYGQNWIAYDLGQTRFEEIHFTDALHGWASGSEAGHTAMKGGYIWGTEHVYLTNDGGMSWEQVR
jgi:hypothetical protein